MLDKDEIIVLDDVIPKELQDRIEDIFLGGRIPWAFFPDIALSREEIKGRGITSVTPGFGASILQDKPYYIDNNLFKETTPIIKLACDRVGLECKGVLQGRSFMLFPLADSVKKEFDNIHVDLSKPHTVCLYYVNDTDGDTFLFDKTRDDIRNMEEFEATKFKVHKQVSPKKGRVVLFNGQRYHSSSCPSKTVRCIINFDITTVRKNIPG
jgi:hypothetical protein